jgi:hypothetical protein
VGWVGLEVGTKPGLVQCGNGTKPGFVRCGKGTKPGLLVDKICTKRQFVQCGKCTDFKFVTRPVGM